MTTSADGCVLCFATTAAAFVGLMVVLKPRKIPTVLSYQCSQLGGFNDFGNYFENDFENDFDNDVEKAMV